MINDILKMGVLLLERLAIRSISLLSRITPESQEVASAVLEAGGIDSLLHILKVSTCIQMLSFFFNMYVQMLHSLYKPSLSPLV